MMWRSVVLVLLVSSPALAELDTQLWLAGSVQLELSERSTWGFEQHLRFERDVHAFASVMTEVQPTFSVTDRLRLEGGYRFIYERAGNEQLEVWHRFFLGARVDLVDDGPVRLDARLRFQEQVRLEEGREHRHTGRTRLRLRWKAHRHLVLSCAAELFVRLADESAMRLSQLRYGAGLDVGGDAHQVSLALRHEKALDGDRDALILALEYELRL